MCKYTGCQYSIPHLTGVKNIKLHFSTVGGNGPNRSPPSQEILLLLLLPLLLVLLLLLLLLVVLTVIIILFIELAIRIIGMQFLSSVRNLLFKFVFHESRLLKECLFIDTLYASNPRQLNSKRVK